MATTAPGLAEYQRAVDFGLEHGLLEDNLIGSNFHLYVANQKQQEASPVWGFYNRNVGALNDIGSKVVTYLLPTADLGPDCGHEFFTQFASQFVQSPFLEKAKQNPNLAQLAGKHDAKFFSEYLPQILAFHTKYYRMFADKLLKIASS